MSQDIQNEVRRRDYVRAKAQANPMRYLHEKGMDKEASRFMQGLCPSCGENPRTENLEETAGWCQRCLTEALVEEAVQNMKVVG